MVRGFFVFFILFSNVLGYCKKYIKGFLNFLEFLICIIWIGNVFFFDGVDYDFEIVIVELLEEGSRKGYKEDGLDWNGLL